MEPWTAAKKKKKKKNVYLVWRCYRQLHRVPSQRPLTPSVASVTSVANDKGGNEMAFALWSRKTSARKSSDEGAVRPVIASNGVTFLQTKSVG